MLISDAYGRPRCAVAPATVCAIASQSDDGKLVTFKDFDTRGPGAEVAKFQTEPTDGYACLSLQRSKLPQLSEVGAD